MTGLPPCSHFSRALFEARCQTLQGPEYLATTKLSWCTDEGRWDEAPPPVLWGDHASRPCFCSQASLREVKVNPPFFYCCCCFQQSRRAMLLCERHNRPGTKTGASAFSTRVTPAPIIASIVFVLPAPLRHRSSSTHARICFSGQ